MACGTEADQQGGKKQPLEVPVALDGDTATTLDSSKFTTVQWIDSTIDIGKIAPNSSVNVEFRFRNTGTQPLYVQNVSAACGCTVPEMQTAPVMPGKESVIKAVFNSSGQSPNVQKGLTVTMNTKGTQYHRLSFSGTIQQ